MSEVAGHELHGSRVGEWPAGDLVDLWGRVCSGVVKQGFVIELRDLEPPRTGIFDGLRIVLDPDVSFEMQCFLLLHLFGHSVQWVAPSLEHKLADLLLDVELAKSAAYYAAQAAASDDPEWPALASLAKAAASETYLRMAAECIQLHGGIGFTWDNDTHLWFKRAKSSEVFLGQPNYHRELLMQRWGV